MEDLIASTKANFDRVTAQQREMLGTFRQQLQDNQARFGPRSAPALMSAWLVDKMEREIEECEADEKVVLEKLRAIYEPTDRSP